MDRRSVKRTEMPVHLGHKLLEHVLLLNLITCWKTPGFLSLVKLQKKKVKSRKIRVMLEQYKKIKS